MLSIKLFLTYLAIMVMYRHEQTNSLYKRINLLIDKYVYNLYPFSNLYQASCIQRPRMLKAPVLR